MIAAGGLDALAERYGIEPEFIDAKGVLRQTSSETKRALLTALGVEAGDDAAASEALRVSEAADWERALPPVVVSLPREVRIGVVLPRGTAQVGWRLKLEAGGERSGSFDFGELPELASTERHGGVLERRELRLPADIPEGYHRLSLDGAEMSLAEMSLIVTPGRCWLPPAVESGARLSGVALQIYLLRSAANWGIGDYSDLRRFVELVAARGGDVVGLSPLHEMFVDDPEHASPYSPASRLRLNVLNIDVSAIPEFATSEPAQARVREPGFAERLRTYREAALVDYSGVAELKLDVLRLVFASFAAAQTERSLQFKRDRRSDDVTAERTALFGALRLHFAKRDPARAAWQKWPPEYRDPESPAVAAFARDHAEEVTFFAWLQWIADAQLAAAARAGQSMRVGLYRDLAVGADPGGAETWTNARAVITAARVGAPPDIYNPPGQNWDLPPFHPQALRAEAYASFIELLRANMRHAGGLRIDHVMALHHLYWIPQGATPADGAYVRYPLDDLIGILALESQRARCIVVGEDLGTVPAGFRDRMAEANVLSYRVLFFERETDEAAAFIAPAAYPSKALAVLGSHDLPTLDAWWSGADIGLRERLGLLPDEAAVSAQRETRARDAAALTAALEAAAVLEPGQSTDREAIFAAAHAFLAMTPCALAIAQIDDVTAETLPVNVPTTSDENPNWRRRLSRTIEELETDARLATLFDVLREAGRLRG